MNIKTKIITHTGICIALGTLLSMIKIFNLPQGGSVTLCSTLFFILPGYWFGLSIGIIAGLIAGIINFICDPIFLHPLQFVFDYILAFGCLGLSQIFIKNKSKNHGLLIKSYLIAMLFKLSFNITSGILFFASYTPNNMPIVFYSFLYNLSYTGPEIILTLILLQVPILKKMFN